MKNLCRNVNWPLPFIPMTLVQPVTESSRLHFTPNPTRKHWLPGFSSPSAYQESSNHGSNSLCLTVERPVDIDFPAAGDSHNLPLVPLKRSRDRLVFLESKKRSGEEKIIKVEWSAENLPMSITPDSPLSAIDLTLLNYYQKFTPKNSKISPT